MFIEEALNKGYMNDEIDHYRLIMDDPSLQFDLSKVSLDGGNPITEDSLSSGSVTEDSPSFSSTLFNTLSKCVSISQWNLFGPPKRTLGEASSALKVIESRKKENIIELITASGSYDFAIPIHNKQYYGENDKTNYYYDMEIGKTYTIELFVKFNNRKKASFKFCATPEAWEHSYGITFSEDQIDVNLSEDDKTKWTKITVDVYKNSEGFYNKSFLILYIFDIEEDITEFTMLLSDLKLYEKIGE